jgi:hypothetical protein
MGFRFRRTVRVLPGMHLNLSQRGLSTTLGSAGLSMNLGRHGLRPDVGLPGTGLSYRFEPVDVGVPAVPAPQRSTLRGVIAIFAAMFAVVAFVFGVVSRLGRFVLPHARVVASAVTTKLLAMLH